MRINIALPLSCSFKQELYKKIGPLKIFMHKDSPHCQWLDIEEWRVTLGFLRKLDNGNDVGLICRAVEQAVFGFGPITGVTEKFRVLPDDGVCYHYYGNRSTVGLTFKKGHDKMTELSTIIAEKMNCLLPGKYIQFTRPYITLVRKGRKRRPCLYVRGVSDIKLYPLECVFKKVALYISDKQPSGNVYVLKKSARLI